MQYRCKLSKLRPSRSLSKSKQLRLQADCHADNCACSSRSRQLTMVPSHGFPIHDSIMSCPVILSTYQLPFIVIILFLLFGVQSFYKFYVCQQHICLWHIAAFVSKAYSPHLVIVIGVFQKCGRSKLKKGSSCSFFWRRGIILPRGTRL